MIIFADRRKWLSVTAKGLRFMRLFGLLFQSVTRPKCISYTQMQGRNLFVCATAESLRLRYPRRPYTFMYLFMQVCIYVPLICMCVCSFPSVPTPIYQELMLPRASASGRTFVRVPVCECVSFWFLTCQSRGRARLISAASCSLYDVGWLISC